MARRTIRWYAAAIDRSNAERWAIKRQANKLRATGNKFDKRRADVLDGQAQNIRDRNQPLREAMVSMGETLFRAAPAIDAEIPRNILLDLLNINISDRSKADESDGFIQLTFVKNLEDSATYRNSDFDKGPFATATTAYMQHEIIHNDEIAEMMHEKVFGEGGMFEFLPRYKEHHRGEMVRQPPKLRAVK